MPQYGLTWPNLAQHVFTNDTAVRPTCYLHRAVILRTNMNLFREASPNDATVSGSAFTVKKKIGLRES
jgi:hypothetical protein